MTKYDARELLRITARWVLGMFALGAFLATFFYLTGTYLLGYERTTEFWWNASVKVVMFSGVGGGVILAIMNVIDYIREAKLDRNGLTKAGRALQKHGDRSGSVFSKSTGKAVARNQQGQDIVEGISKSGNRTSRYNRFGGEDFIDKNTGRGVRIDGDGNMMGSSSSSSTRSAP